MTKHFATFFEKLTTTIQIISTQPCKSTKTKTPFHENKSAFHYNKPPIYFAETPICNLDIIVWLLVVKHCLIPTWDLSGFFEFQLISKVGCEKVKACKYPQPKVFGGYFRHAAAHRVKSCKGICSIGRREKVRYSFPYGRHRLPWPRKTCQKQHRNR